jgi:hypothetical protein
MYIHRIPVIPTTGTTWNHIVGTDKLHLVFEIDNTPDFINVSSIFLNTLLSYFSENPKDQLPIDIETTIKKSSPPHEARFIIAYQNDTELVLFSQGIMEAYLLRNNSWGRICKKGTYVTGRIQPEDLILLLSYEVSPSIAQIFSENVVKTIHTFNTQELIQKKVQQLGLSKYPCAILIVSDKKQNPQPSKKSFFQRQNHFLPRKYVKIAGAIIGILLIVFILFGSSLKTKTENKVAENELSSKVEKLKFDAKALIGLDNEKAIALLDQASLLLTNYSKNSNKSDQIPPDITKQIDTVNSLKQQAQGIITVIPESYFSLDWISPEAEASKITVENDFILLLDTKNGSVYKIGIRKKNPATILSNEVLTKAQSIAGYENKIFILTENNNNPFILNENATPVIPYDSQWGALIDISAYSGNMYIFDGSGIIWKYNRLSEDTYASKSAYFKDTETNPYETATSLSVDGLVWVLTKSRLYKYASGAPKPFTYSSNKPEEPKKVMSYADSDTIYIWSQNKLLAFNKEGSYIKQYVWTLSNDIKDVAVSFDTKQAFLTDGKTILTIPLQ